MLLVLPGAGAALSPTGAPHSCCCWCSHSWCDPHLHDMTTHVPPQLPTHLHSPTHPCVCICTTIQPSMCDYPCLPTLHCPWLYMHMLRCPCLYAHTLPCPCFYVHTLHHPCQLQYRAMQQGLQACVRGRPISKVPEIPEQL